MRSTWTSRWKRGMKAPAFKTVLDDGRVLDSAEIQGHSYILFFYNHDGSETCTKEACNIRDHYDILRSHGYIVYGVSEDSIKKHERFRLKYNLPYPLISDTDNTLAKTFDIFGPKEFMGRTSDAVHRTTFVIDATGMITAVIHPVDSANHTRQILDALALK